MGWWNKLIRDKKAKEMEKRLKVTTWIILYLCTIVASSSGFVFPLGDENEWFNTLVEPSFRPPNWLFGPVWTTLYLLIATSAYKLIFTADLDSVLSRRNQPIYAVAIALWSLQLALNVIWTPVFSGAQDLGAAFLYIVLLWVSIVAYILVTWRVNKVASVLMIPYLCWVSFASILNYTYWQLNI